MDNSSQPDKVEVENDIIILRPMKLKYLILLLSGVFIIAFFGIMMILVGILVGWLVLVALLFFLFLAKFVFDSHYLILDSEGFTLKGLLGSTSYKWVDIEEFRVVWEYFFKAIMFRYSNSPQSTSIAHTIVRKLSFDLCTFLNIYAMKAEDLAALMNKLREQATHSSDGNRP